MQVINSYSINIDIPFCEEDLANGVHLTILHASRIPPHIGMVINNHYHSLSIKGQEIDQSVVALIKNSKIRRIPSLFLKIRSHPNFSNEQLNELFISSVKQFYKVESGKATCMSPVKLFFEAYQLPMNNVNYLFDLLPKLYEAGSIENVSSLFIEGSEFTLPVYTFEDINKGIDLANTEIREIKRSVK